MNNEKRPQVEKNDKEKALEIIPAILGGIFLILGMAFNDSTLKMVFFALAAAVGGGAFIVVLIKELINRKKNGKK